MEKTISGVITAQTTQNAQSKVYFDCATMMEERGVVYDEMTPENIKEWFKESKFKFPVRIMGEQDFRAWLYRKDGEAFIKVYRYDQANDTATDKWTLRIGKTITKSRWFGITQFITDYITGDLQEKYGWSENKTLNLV